MDHRLASWSARGLCLAFVGVLVSACASELQEDSASSNSALHGDCDQSDLAGKLVVKARAGTLFDAHISWRQTDDAGQGIATACNLASSAVTGQGMRDVALHCGGASQAQRGFARVGARWGTSRGEESCSGDYCAVIYVEDQGGSLREAARDIHLQDRFNCSQTSDRNDSRLDVDACTYADVVGALKGTAPSADQSNLTFDSNGKLSGYGGKNLSLKYRMYKCGSASTGGHAPSPSGGGGGGGTGGTGPGPGCTDAPPAGAPYSCAQQAGWGKCGEAWMQGFCNASCGRC